MFQAGDIIAMWQYPDGKLRALKATVLGGTYLDSFDYVNSNGIQCRGSTTSTNRISLEFLKRDAKLIKSPETPYGDWHICLCEDCERVGGRVWLCGDGTWDDHKRFIVSGDAFEFRTVRK